MMYVLSFKTCWEISPQQTAATNWSIKHKCQTPQTVSDLETTCAPSPPRTSQFMGPPPAPIPCWTSTQGHLSWSHSPALFTQQGDVHLLPTLPLQRTRVNSPGPMCHHGGPPRMYQLDLSIPPGAQVNPNLFHGRTCSPEAYIMLAHVRMLRLPHIPAPAVCPHSPSVLKRNWLRFKHGTHPNLSLLPSLLPLFMHNIFLPRLLWKSPVPHSSLQRYAEQIAMSPRASEKTKQTLHRLHTVGKTPMVL